MSAVASTTRESSPEVNELTLGLIIESFPWVSQPTFKPLQLIGAIFLPSRLPTATRGHGLDGL